MTFLHAEREPIASRAAVLGFGDERRPEIHVFFSAIFTTKKPSRAARDDAA
jgi:hypothetical protein